ELASRLVDITPEPLQSVFFSDSGSVSVEVAMKMAIQYWHSKGRADKKHFLSLRKGYHGDTFAAMSVCDPVTGMHSLFSGALLTQYFSDSPACRFGDSCADKDIADLENQLANHHPAIAGLIMEPIVQGAGGMWFYSADYLQKARVLCDRYGVLLILDEIATGFGRTGKLFACEHADISPDIMCVGKALTGGYLTLAATLTTQEISQVISRGDPGVFMHGPTFMANPLACSAGLASLQLLLEADWKTKISTIEKGLKSGLSPCEAFESVRDVRVLGAIGVVEMKHPVDMEIIQPLFVNAGVWVRPFGRLIYLMPPYLIEADDLTVLTTAVRDVISKIDQHPSEERI
ncbi:MAG: adenosylmethionine--8-amino-7-oxononanoate transaminase, partial [Gammaproteobacteria bacterium]